MSEQNINLAVMLLLGLTRKAGEVSASILKARGEGRDLTDAELQPLLAEDDLQAAMLEEAIERSKLRLADST